MLQITRISLRSTVGPYDGTQNSYGQELAGRIAIFWAISSKSQAG